MTLYIAAMPFLWLDINDDPGPTSLRGAVERNAIALLSNLARQSFDAPSPAWLGHSSDRPLVRDSGMWNQRHVDEAYDPAFLFGLRELVGRAGAAL